MLKYQYKYKYSKKPVFVESEAFLLPEHENSAAVTAIAEKTLYS